MLQNSRTPINERASSPAHFDDGHDLDNKIKIRLGEFGPSRYFFAAVSPFRYFVWLHPVLHDIESWVSIESMMFDWNNETRFRSCEYTKKFGFRIGLIAQESENYTRFESIYICIFLLVCLNSADGNSCFYFWCWLLNYKSSIIVS